LLSLNFIKFETFIKKFSKILSLAIFAILLFFLVFNFLDVYQNLNNDRSEREDAHEAVAWIDENVPDQAIIYHPDWSESAIFAYHNTNNYYISGLDPNFLKHFDADLYEKWLSIFEQRELGSLHIIIKKDFNSSFLLINVKNEETLNHINQSTNFLKLFGNNHYTVFLVQ
jgi:hypothetical protein